MSEEVAKLLAQAVDLPASDRQQIIDHLTEVAITEQVVDDLWADPEFRAEIERRMECARQNPDRLIDAQQALDELRARYVRNPTP